MASKLVQYLDETIKKMLEDGERFKLIDKSDYDELPFDFGTTDAEKSNIQTILGGVKVFSHSNLRLMLHYGNKTIIITRFNGRMDSIAIKTRD